MMIMQLSSRVSSFVRCFARGNLLINKFSSVSLNVKHRTPQKRATKLLHEIGKEEFCHLRNGRAWPEFRAGDSIEVEELSHTTATETTKIRGVVVGIYNKLSDTSIELVNCEYGTPIIRTIVLYNPLIKNVKVLQKRFVRKGERRVKRGKLYYLYDLDPQKYTVSYK